ncbi:MAG: NF038143 family protein [Deltaproteobacteria bacterium]|nr:NF038143 family protein [Deltaproteobacteria bacterium]
MMPLVEKKELILEHEARFAQALAREVLPSPKMNFWMIFIPFVLVYHMVRHKRVVEGRKEFVANYLLARKHACEEVFDSAKRAGKPRTDVLVRDSRLPQEARGPFRGLLTLLVDHYTELLRSPGHDMPSLLRSAYKNRTNYLLFLNRVNETEKLLHKALRPHMHGGGAEIDDVMRRMETSSESLRREETDRVFKG